MNFQVLSRRVELCVGPVDAFEALSDKGRAEGHFLLETVDGVRGINLLLVSPCVRISGDAERVVIDALTENGRALLRRCRSLLPHLCVEADDNRLQLHYPKTMPLRDEKSRLRSPGPLDAVRSVLSAFAASDQQDASQLMVAGLFDFEIIELFERFTPFAESRKEGLFRLYIPEIVVRCARDSRHGCVSAVVFSDEPRGRLANELSRQLANVVERLSQAVESRHTFSPATPQPSVPVDDQTFGAYIERARSHLYAGDAFQIVLSRRFEMECPDPLLAYRALREENPSPYMFYMAGPGTTLFGASPESAVKVNGATRTFEISPIAGTRARGRTSDGKIDYDLDARTEVELRCDDKELAEHMMLVDLARNDVARVCEPGTRHLYQLMTVERYSRVMHLVSHVRGVLRPEIDVVRALATVMPMGTLSGAPKISVVQIIRDIEKRPRRSYGGAIGYIDAAGNMDTAIVIRAASVRDQRATVQAGAGIVLKSDPQSEANETRRKAESVLRAIASAKESVHGS